MKSLKRRKPFKPQKELAKQYYVSEQLPVKRHMESGFDSRTDNDANSISWEVVLLSGCHYCRRQRTFWASEESGKPDAPQDLQNAHILAGTNIFSDTAGRQIRFMYCPMCGEPLLKPPDDGGGKVGVFAALFPPKLCNSITKLQGACKSWVK